ncbi:MAG: flagellar export chaperone FliS [Planctomycetota bacterium]|jgi:flagellar protein FliS
MSASTTNPYLRTKVMTASPAELRMMLLEGALKFTRQGRDGLEARDYEAAYNGVSRAQSILMELINGLRPEHDPKLCERISSLYTYLYLQLMRALRERDTTVIDEVLKRLEYERETWAMLLEKLSDENRAAGDLADIPDVPAATDPESPPDDLVGGTVWKA